MRGRLPKPIEQHRKAGTYRADRHGPRLRAVAEVEPEVVGTVSALDGTEGIVCECHGELVVVELLDNHRWRAVRVDGESCTESPGAA